MKIYNSMTRKKEEFKPIEEGKVKMYACGITVYDLSHIGHARQAIVYSMIAEYLRFRGYDVKYVRNYTDVDDKIINRANILGKDPLDFSKEQIREAEIDMKELHVKDADVKPKASENIDNIIKFVQGLIKKGYAYESSNGDVYYIVRKFNEYGKLSNRNIDELINGVRKNVEVGKRDPLDFALWKAAKPGEISWNSPWGKGRPGWHIECSAMGQKYLGEQFDIHTGGVDHIPVHHENEIAQNEALTGKKSVDYWMHGEFMLVNNGKMSKSLGNTYRISQLEEMGYTALDFRYFCLNAHYRKKLNFTFEGLDAAKKSYERLLGALYQHKTSPKSTDEEKLARYKKEFEDAINDDLNIPMALGVLWKMVREEKSKDIYKLALDMDKVFGLSLDKAKAVESDEAESDTPDEVTALVNERS